MGLTLAIGIATGCVYALVAVGYSLIYRTTGVVNFAQGGYVMIGGFATWWFFSIAALPYPLAIASGVAVATLIGLLLWTVVVLPLWRRRSPPYVVLLATIVFGAIVGNATLLLLGTLPQTLPPWVPGLAFEFEGNRIDGQYGLIIAASLLSLIAFGAVLQFFLARTRDARLRGEPRHQSIAGDFTGADRRSQLCGDSGAWRIRRRHDHTSAVHLVRSRARIRRLRICCGSAGRISGACSEHWSADCCWAWSTRWSVVTFHRITRR